VSHPFAVIIYLYIDGVNKSAKVAEAIQAGIGQMGDIAWRQAMCMLPVKRPIVIITQFLQLLQ
jgi:hypothetical protein